jgi:hypothetical protein
MPYVCMTARPSSHKFALSGLVRFALSGLVRFALSGLVRFALSGLVRFEDCQLYLPLSHRSICCHSSLNSNEGEYK